MRPHRRGRSDRHRGRMLEEAVRRFLSVSRTSSRPIPCRPRRTACGRTVVHGAHHSRQHRAVADAGVEHANRRRARMQVRQLFGDPVRHFHFLLQVLTNSRYFCRLSKKRELRCGSVGFAPAAVAPPAAARRAAAAAERKADAFGDLSITIGRGPCGGWVAIKPWIRSSVSVVMRPPLRSRAVSLPSLTARRPKVDSASPVDWQ